MYRWKLSTLAAAAFAATAFSSFHASALTLGALRVDSALGESLRAEIAIPQATPAELSNLIVQIASPESFRARGLDYSAAASAINVQLAKKPDGSAVLQLRSNSPLNDPFIDVVVDTKWNTGSIQRSYTLLLDPPATKSRTAAVNGAQAAPPTPASVSGKSYSSSTPPTRIVVTAPQRAPTASPATASSDTVKVRTGDTAGRIANANLPAGASLDQMLVALLRHNPKAFINGNVNLLRAGAVLKMPSREQALETSAQEARQIVTAQSSDFNTYRRTLASKAPQATVQAADRSTSGQVQAQVSEPKDATEKADKLTLTKGSVQNVAKDEALAAQKQAEVQDSRMSELQRNLAELNELAQSTPPASSATSPTTQVAATTAAAPPVETAAPTDAAQALTTLALESGNAASVEPAATAGTPAENTSDAASTTPAPENATAQPPRPAPMPAPAAETSLLDDPLLPAGGALIAILLGLLGYSVWKRRRAAATATELDAESEDIQSHLNTVLDDNNEQNVDTKSMAYTPSQMDGGADVDPVAEADVYLAYGRDMQAEEVLKEALLTQPERLAVYVKLAEIYAQRGDAASLIDIARNLQPLTPPTSAEWQRVMELSQQTAPENALFTDARSAQTASQGSSFAAALQAAPFAPEAPLNTPPILLDVNDVEQRDSSQPNDAFHLDLSGFEAPWQQSTDTPVATSTASVEDPYGLPPLDMNVGEPMVPTIAPATENNQNFNLDALNLDLGTGTDFTPANNAEPMHNLANDPLSTKLDLAREFNTIGDSEGARALIEEVLADASGPLRARAQQMLSELD